METPAAATVLIPCPPASPRKLIIRGEIPSLKRLRLHIPKLSEYCGTPEVLRLLPLPGLEHLEVLFLQFTDK